MSKYPPPIMLSSSQRGVLARAVKDRVRAMTGMECSVETQPWNYSHICMYVNIHFASGRNATIAFGNGQASAFLRFWDFDRTWAVSLFADQITLSAIADTIPEEVKHENLMRVLRGRRKAKR